MIRQHASAFAAGAALLTSALLLAAGPAEGGDRIPPTPPRNLTVTGVEPYAVSLTWSPSRDNSGEFSYLICCANVSDEMVDQSVTSHTYRNGLEAGRSFSLRVYAVDAAGNFSRPSNTVSGVLPADTVPPTQPVVTVGQVGSTYVMLDWQSQDNGPHVWYTVYRDGGAPFIRSSAETSGIATLLEPETTYSFTVKAVDFAGNASPLSEPVAVTTAPINPADVTPPTVPGNLRANRPTEDGEIRLTWDQSVDDLDPQTVIRYDIRLNGVLDSVVVGHGRQFMYLTERGTNTITVTAQDTAGNTSDPASVTVQF